LRSDLVQAAAMRQEQPVNLRPIDAGDHVAPSTAPACDASTTRSSPPWTGWTLAPTGSAPPAPRRCPLNGSSTDRGS
jgi:hypothetical protein